MKSFPANSDVALFNRGFSELCLIKGVIIPRCWGKELSVEIFFLAEFWGQNVNFYKRIRYLGTASSFPMLYKMFQVLEYTWKC